MSPFHVVQRADISYYFSPPHSKPQSLPHFEFSRMNTDLHDKSRALAIVIACIVAPLIASLFVLVRVWTRVFVRRAAGWDDCMTVSELTRNLDMATITLIKAL